MADQSTTETRSAADGLGLDYPKIEAMVSQLANAISQTKMPPGSGDGPITLRADYQITMEVVKLLSDIRFRCLVFVTAIITIATALLPGTGDSGTRIILGFVGFLATLGITVYELRNSQLYEAACHRAKMIEGRLGMEKFSKYGNQGGLFGERPKYTKRWKDLSSEEQTNLNTGKDVPLMSFWLVPVKHDHGLACIYGAALGGWVYLIANGLL